MQATVVMCKLQGQAHVPSHINNLPIVIISCQALVMLKMNVISLDEEYDMP